MKVFKSALGLIALVFGLLLVLMAGFSTLHVPWAIRVLWGIVGAAVWVGGSLMIRPISK